MTVNAALFITPLIYAEELQSFFPFLSSCSLLSSTLFLVFLISTGFNADVSSTDASEGNKNGEFSEHLNHSKSI